MPDSSPPPAPSPATTPERYTCTRCHWTGVAASLADAQQQHWEANIACTKAASYSSVERAPAVEEDDDGEWVGGRNGRELCDRRWGEGCTPTSLSGFGDAHMCDEHPLHKGACVCGCGQSSVPASDAPAPPRKEDFATRCTVCAGTFTIDQDAQAHRGVHDHCRTDTIPAPTAFRTSKPATLTDASCDSTPVCGDVPPGEDVWASGDRCELPRGHEGSHEHRTRYAMHVGVHHWHRMLEGVVDGTYPEPAAASPAQEATPPREGQHQGWTKNDQPQEPVLTPESPPRMTGRSAMLALGMAAAILGAPPMGRRIRSTGDADVDASLDRALANRERLLADEARLAAANAKRARKNAKRARDHAR